MNIFLFHMVLLCILVITDAYDLPSSYRYACCLSQFEVSPPHPRGRAALALGLEPRGEPSEEAA